MKKKIIVVYILVVHLLLFSSFFKSPFLARIKYRVAIQSAGSEFTPHYHEMVTYHMRMDGSVPENAAIFIGNSIVQGLAVSAVTPLAVNYGIGYDTSLGVLRRISLYQSIKKAGVVIVSIGINDMRIRSNQEILNNYKKILQAIPDRIPLIFSAVLPVDERMVVIPIKNNRIQRLNRMLESLCESSSRVQFVNATDLLSDETGNLLGRFHTGDGIHLNSSGYMHWIASLKKAMQQIKYGKKVTL